MPSLYCPPATENAASTTVTDAVQTIPSVQQQQTTPAAEPAKVSRFKVQTVPEPSTTPAAPSAEPASLQPPPVAVAGAQTPGTTASTSTVNSTGGLTDSLMQHLESELRKVSGVSATTQPLVVEHPPKAAAVGAAKPPSQQQAVPVAGAQPPAVASNSSKSHTPGPTAELQHNLAGLTEKLQALSAKQQQLHAAEDAHHHHAPVPVGYATSAGLSRAGSMAPPDEVDSVSSAATLPTGAHSVQPIQVETLNGLANALQKVRYCVLHCNSFC